MSDVEIIELLADLCRRQAEVEDTIALSLARIGAELDGSTSGG